MDTNPLPADTTADPVRRRTSAIGATAGLLGGAAVGLLLTVPSITSAASADDTTVDDATVVALQDDDATGGTTDEAQPGARIRAVLQDLVDDGTLTAEQADAAAEHLAERAPERHRRHRGDRPGADGEVVAGLLGVDVETLREELAAGNSVADIAAANGVDVQTVIDALVDEAEGHLDLAVEHGRLTEEEAADKLESITARITARVNGERAGRG